MNRQKDNYCVILAGGKGRRLWPCSRDRRPKQFVDFFGYGRTQLQLTYDRFLKIIPRENIIVATTKEYVALVREQLPDVAEENLIVEPVNRNTAPSVAWANLHILSRNAGARVIVAPSDQLIIDEDMFTANVSAGLEFVAEHDVSLTMGVEPTRPEPGYGYIQTGDATEKAGIFKVQSFTEKPEREFARMFVDSGEFLWNTGLFLFNSRHLHHIFLDIFMEDRKQAGRKFLDLSIEEAIEFTKENYPSSPNMSLDHAVLEKQADVCVMKCGFGWADLGSWHAVYECMSTGGDSNVAIDSDVIMEECSDNVIKLPKGKLGVINGLDGYIVVDTDDVLLICKKGDSSSLVRKCVNEAQIKFGDKYI